VRITDYLGRWADAAPDREAAVLGDIRITYAELERRVDRLARALVAAGVRRGDRVATLCTPHPDFYVTFLASASVGAMWLGLNPKYTLEELRYVVDDANPSVLFARTRIGDRAFGGDLAQLCRGSKRDLVALDNDDLPARAEPFSMFDARARSVTAEDLARARALVEPGDAAMLVYTSGTTGRPKGAMLPHRGLVKCSEVQAKIWTADPLRILNNFPINHVGCVGDICCYVLVSGGTIVFNEQFDPKEVLRTIEQERITAYGQIPAMFAMTLEEADRRAGGLAGCDMSSVQIIIWSGAAASRELILKLRQINHRMSSSYGLTESVGSVTYVHDTEDLEILADTIGWPHPACEFRLASADGTPVPVGEPGEIQVRGDFIMLGYLNRDEATREAIDAAGWLHTGDLAVERPDGAIKLIGRLKEMFKSGGYNVYPREIEIALEAHPAVRLAAVISVPDPLYVEVGHAFVVAEGLGEEELREHCRTRLANYKVPKRFTVARDLPLLPIGKVDKRALRAMVTPA
jgi:acyl-CoA synthetase (AMP-forming)/AMP-acid ligase II